MSDEEKTPVAFKAISRILTNTGDTTLILVSNSAAEGLCVFIYNVRQCVSFFSFLLFMVNMHAHLWGFNEIFLSTCSSLLYTTQFPKTERVRLICSEMKTSVPFPFSDICCCSYLCFRKDC